MQQSQQNIPAISVSSQVGTVASMKSFQPFAVAAAALLSSPGADAFAPVSSRRVAAIAPSVRAHRHGGLALPSRPPNGPSPRLAAPTALFASNDGSAEDDRLGGDDVPSRRPRPPSSLRRRAKPVGLALLAATATLLPGRRLVPPAWASAPIVLRPSMKKDDPPIVQAYKKAEKIKKAKSLEEFDAFMAKCNDIEEAEGKAARNAYEKQYQLDKEAAEAQKKVDIENLRRELLDKGQDPHTDLDAERAVFLLEHDVDLEKVSGTPQNEAMIKNFQSRGRKKMGKGGGEAPEEFVDQRYIVACQVADLKARGVDPMEHFGKDEVKEKTRAIYMMDDRVAAKVAGQYRGLMEEHGGRLTPAKEGEVPFVYEAAKAGEGAAAVAAASGAKDKVNPGRGAKRRNERAMARAARRVQRRTDRAARREARVAAKAEKREERLAAREKGEAGRAAAAAAALAAKEAAAAAASEAVAVGAAAVSDSVPGPTVESTAVTEQPPEAAATSSEAGGILSQIKNYATPQNAAIVVVGGGAVNYGINYYRENNGAAQSERERQLRLILGEDDEEDDDEDEFDDDEDG